MFFQAAAEQGANIKGNDVVRYQCDSTHVQLLQSVDGVFGIQQFVGELHDLLVHRLFVPLHLP